VSYALPALIAIGQARHHHAPSRNPLARLVRELTRARTLRVLTGIQPDNGGFLEATPLTSFVTMSLAGSGRADHVVTKRGVEFLLQSQRTDGSWPIDTNLATWLTTLALNALNDLPTSNLESPVRSWLLSQQHRVEHPYTHAAPGGWAWTDLPGGVPDCDDTPGAVLASAALAEFVSPARLDEYLGRKFDPIIPVAKPWPPVPHEERFQPDVGSPQSHIVNGLNWIDGLQNRDGGFPTFCTGWGKLPFDRSGSDLTAHALRAGQQRVLEELEAPTPTGAPAARVLDAEGRLIAILAAGEGRWTIGRVFA
jgi:squalene-hopene/tetraprenyl-beta-curcumene cyclase